jgi:class 3 adenylate cyclase
VAYEPKPIDTSRVKLTDDILRLAEQLAENTHDVWAQQRMAEGWRYGPERSDRRKEHPSLVPYERLPESEKEYDRRTALETIKALLGMGYKLHPPALPASLGDDASARDIEKLLQSSGPLPRSTLMELWDARDPEVWPRNPQLYRLLGERILRLQEPLVAYDVVKEGLEHSTGDVRLRQLGAFALARSGASAAAIAELVRLRDEGHADEETLGILGGRLKEQALQARRPEEAQRLFRQAFEVYSDASKAPPGYYRKINAATMALLLGDKERAHTLAREVYAACLEELERIRQKAGNPYWVLASLGEAGLVLEDWAEVTQWYSQAAEAGRGNYGDLSSTRRNVRLLLKHLRRDDQQLEQLFRIPRVVVFAGHMIDQPGRATPRFPAVLEPAVHSALRERLKQIDAGFGYAAAACGGDILFHEALLELGGETHVILPYARELFIRDSVDFAGAGWRARCEDVIKRAEEVQEASGQRLIGGGASYDYANLLLQGLACLRGEQFDTELVAMAVWDGKPGDGPGGTASVVERWKRLSYRVELINLTDLLARESPGLAAVVSQKPKPAPPAQPPPEFAPEIRGLLFADAVGFSKLTDDEVPRFVKHFLGMVADLVKNSRYAPETKNTWGDGLYMVFRDVRDAGQFALELCDRVRSMDWKAKGLGGLSLRIGVHAGPVYGCVDPVIEGKNYIGAHVSRAARIEPVTPPGEVYASQPFAALAVAQRVEEFRCDYVGRTSLAKKYGVYPTYVVRPR